MKFSFKYLLFTADHITHNLLLKLNLPFKN